MDAKLSIDDVGETLAHFKSLSQAVDELAKQRAQQEPYILPSTFTKQGPRLTAADLDVGQLINQRASLGPGVHASQTSTQYKHARAAAAEVARITSAGKRGVLRPTSRSSQLSVTSHDGVGTQPPQQGTRTVQVSTPPPAFVPDSNKAHALLALPGQLAYRQLLVSARRSRAPEAQAFIEELDALDDEINQYLEADRQQRASPAAAVMLQSAWRARGPRIMFNSFMMQRKVAALRTLAAYLGPLKQLVAALRHQRHRMLSQAFHEWKALGQLKILLYAKVLKRLKASMIDVRDSQSPNHLWRLCTSPGQDPWKAQIGLGALCRNLIQAQAPRRKLHSYFSAWRGYVQEIAERRRNAVKVLGQLEHERSWELLHNMFRFWYRWAIVKVSERLKIQPPLFRPRLENWDTWLWEHMRSNELRVCIAQLHRGFRLRHCFNFLRSFAARNKKLRQAWMSAAVPQIEALMRYALGCLKANWQIAKAQRRMCYSAFKCWSSIARRNMLVRTIAREAESLSRRSILQLCFRRLREWSHLSRLLSMGATVQILQRRPLCMLPMCAWTGDFMHMWFVATWNAWRNFAVGRIRMRCFLGAHLARAPYLDLELAFKAWTKIVHEQVLKRTEVQLRRQLMAEAAGIQEESEVHTPRGGSRPVGSPSAVAGCQVTSRASEQQHLPGPTVENGMQEGDEMEEELEDGSVHVSCADFPSSTAWRPILSNAAVMAAADEAASGANPSALLHAIHQLYELDGPFLPENDEDDTRQLVLEVAPRAPISLSTRLLLSPDNATQFDLWLSEGSAPDPWIWQRLVGLATCNVQMHPEAPCGQLVNHTALPWAQEVGRIRMKQATARMHMSRQQDASKDAGSSQPPTRRRLSTSQSFASALRGAEADDLDDEEGVKQREDSDGVTAEGEQQLVAMQTCTPCAGSLDEQEKEVMWLHRLALCEDLLEGCVAGLLHIGYKQLTLMYDCIRRVLPSQQAASFKQGDLLVELLRESLRHDTTFQAAAKLYRANRDRVITTGMSLHKHAMALARHCPEFTLTYPDYNPHSAWATAMERVDQEDPDAPPPPIPAARDTELSSAAATADQQRADGKPASPLGATGNRRTPPKSSRLAAPLTSGVLSKAEIIRREMQGLHTPPTPPKADGLSSRSTTPPKTHAGATLTPAAAEHSKPVSPTKPAAAAAVAVAAAAPESRVEAQVRTASFQEPAPPTAKQLEQQEATAEPQPDDTSTPVTPARRPVFQMPKPMSLEEAQAKGVVLGAAAAAILAAKAAAAKKAAAGHKPNSAEVSQLLSKPSAYKQAWRPSGYRKLPGKDGKHEPRAPRMRRMAPLPMLRAVSPPARSEDPFASGLAVQSPGNALASAGGAAAGQAAFRAMMLSTSASAQPNAVLSAGHAVGAHAMEGQQAVGPAQVAQPAEVKVPGPPPAPPKPYNWFGPEGRLFPTILDIPQPSETPSMHELHHRANRLVMERLDTAQFSVPMMPAIIFSEWGDPPATRAAAAAAVAAAAAALQEAKEANNLEGDSPPDGAVPAQDATLASASEHDKQEQEERLSSHKLAHEGGQPKPLTSTPSVPHFKLVNIADMLKPQDEEQCESYRSGYLADEAHEIKRVSDVGAVTNLLDEDAVLAALEEDEIRRTAGLDSDASDDDVEQAAPRRPKFTVTVEQLNIYLGGHMRRRRPVENAVEVVTLSRRDGKPSTPPMVPDGEFESVFDPTRVMRPLSAQQRSLLTGYDLRSELKELMGAEASEVGLMGAEAVLLGTSQLTAEEQAAVQLELDRLEGELAKGVRVRRRLPTKVTHRGSLNRRPTRTSDMGMSPRGSRTSLSGAQPTLDRQGSAGVQPPALGKSPSPSRFFNQAHPDNPFKTSRSTQILAAPSSPTKGLSAAGGVMEESQLQPFKAMKGLRGSPELEPAPGRHSPHKAQQAEAHPPERQSPAKSVPQETSVSPAKQETRPASVSPWEGDANGSQPGGECLPEGLQPEQGAARNAEPISSRPGSSSLRAVAPVDAHDTLDARESALVDTLTGFSQDLSYSQDLVMDKLSVESNSIFPERPTSQGSAHGSIYADSCASSLVNDAPELVLPSQEEAFPISIYSSVTDPIMLPTDAMLAGARAPDANHTDADFIFTNGSSVAGRRQRRKSNLRTQQAAVPLPPPAAAVLPTSFRSQAAAAAVLGPVPEGLGEEAEVELEALRTMWCSFAYTGANDLQLPHPDSDQAGAFNDILLSAAEGDWQRYEAAAGQLVEQLSQVLNQREALEQVGPLPEDAPLSSSLPAAAALGSLGSMTRHGLQGGASILAGQVPRQPHQLQRALSLMEDSIAAAIDPDKLTGLDLNSYSEDLSDLMSRLVVAPMATRYLFWKKVQSISQLKQRVMEDRALEEQLKQLAWNATFAPGHTVRPTGYLPPMEAARHAAAAPGPATTGANPATVHPPGWSSGALSVLTAPRVPWATPIPQASLRPQPAVIPIHQQMRLLPRTGSDKQQQQQQQPEPPMASTYQPSTSTPASTTSGTPASGNRRPVVPNLMLEDTRDQDGGWGPPAFALQGQEALAHRLKVLLAAHQAAKRAAEMQALGLAQSVPGTPDTARGYLTTPNSTGAYDLDQQEAQLEAIANLTIAVHRDTLARHHHRVGHTSSTLIPGKGHMSGWAPSPVLPPGYTGRDGYQDTSDPFTYPPRPRFNAAPNPLPSITLKGAPLAVVTTTTHQAEQLYWDLEGKELQIAVEARPTPVATPVELSCNLPTASGQGRPPRLMALPPLGPVAAPPAYAASEQQLGNILFVTPHEPAFVDYNTRLFDNSFVPGPHALGPVARGEPLAVSFK